MQRTHLFLQIISDEPESALVSSLRVADDAVLSFAIGSKYAKHAKYAVIYGHGSPKDRKVPYAIKLERIIIIPDAAGRPEQTDAFPSP